MQKINWENGTIVKDAFVTIDDTEYTVTPEEIEGTTPLDADNLNLMQDNIEDAIDVLKTQKVLWSGTGLFMRGNQTANLSEPILEQNSGIVLVWSGYANGEAQNNNFVCTYIPKKMLEFGSGYGFFQVMGGTEGIKAYKYVYITNTSITGNDVNEGTHTSGGVTYTNHTAVLRYVIGV